MKTSKTPSQLARNLCPLFIITLLLLLGAGRSLAATITVTNPADSGPGTLRNAVASASSGDTITFAPSLAGATIMVTSGAIILSNNLTIDSSTLASGVQISGNNQSLIFDVTTIGTVTLQSLTLINGNGSGGDGGALYNAGTTTLNACTFTGNATGSGGAIKNATGSLTLNQCTLTGNIATGGGGGGIVNYAPLFVNGCTLDGNSAGYDGGAIYTEGQVTLNSTIAADSPNQEDILVASGGLTLVGTNLVQSIAGSPSGTTPIQASPQLAPLGNYGGPTQTMPPLPGSPAIDAASDAANGFTTDQRGYPRTAGAHVDIGAVEGIYSAAGPGAIQSITSLANGSIQLGFTNVTDAVFPVLATTNLSQPVSNWTQIGFATESPAGSGKFPFIDTQATNYPHRFYRTKSP